MNLRERLEHWATVSPTAIAHISGARRLTFEQLNSQSNAVAAALIEKFGDNRAPVAVVGHREPEMLVAFIGAITSGRPYIPIDTALPNERINHILAIAKPALILTPEKTVQLSRSKKNTPSVQLRPDDLFYIIFTSGSTGTPKGITISRRSLEDFVNWMVREQEFADGGEVFLNQAPFSFDLSVMDLYCSLATGGTLFSISRDLIANPKLLYRALANSNVTIWVSTPSFAEMCLIERTFNQSLLPRVRRFLFCGEILLPNTARRLLDRFPDAQIWNLYGPTEATVATTSVRIDRGILERYSSLPVGRPMPGSEVLVVNEDGDSLPEESRGEIVIKGPNVSSGYLERPDLNAARFSQVNGERTYRTGDWGRFRDGLLFFEGRIDNQIKLNGYRIELGDIEANLRALPMVRDAAVLPVSKNGKTQWLAGFVLPQSKFETLNSRLTTTLREQLSARLPDYMLPRKFFVVEAFPLTTNGKVDKRKLAESL